MIARRVTIQDILMSRTLLFALAALLAASAMGLAYANWPKMRPGSDANTEGQDGYVIPADIRAQIENIPDPGLVKPLEAEEAQRINAERPIDSRPDEAARAFRLRLADQTNYAAALECLSQAIYYEAASEPMDGQKAVAQVVLNRVRHPAYPSSVCSVVYQGAERVTSCQFTFTCDGSLARRPMASLWSRAVSIARQALAGSVFAPVGHATHYHADYVVPYWAASLDKKIQIGRHIFYRFRGGLGSSRSFNQAYSGAESIPAAKADIAAAIEALTGEEVELAEPDPLAHLSSDVVAPVTPPKRLQADSRSGQLVLDADEARSVLASDGNSCLLADKRGEAGAGNEIDRC